MSKGVSRKLANMLKEASPKQKALLVCSDYDSRANNRSGDLLTMEEREAVVSSVTDDKDIDAYNSYLYCYYTYVDGTPLFLEVANRYRAIAKQVVGLLHLIDSIRNQEDTLNIALQAVKNTGSEEATEAMKETLKGRVSCSAARVTIAPDGYVYIDAAPIWGSVKVLAKSLQEWQAAAKAAAIALQEFAAATDSREFISAPLRDMLLEVQMDYSEEVGRRYSLHHLQDIEAAGGRVTDKEKDIAVLPYYEDTKPSAEWLERLSKWLDDYRKSQAGKHKRQK